MMRRSQVERNGEILKKYLETECYESTSLAFSLSALRIKGIIAEFIQIISFDLRAGLGNSSLARQSRIPHPFTPEKYPQLYQHTIEGRGFVSWRIAAAELLCEKEFVLQHVDAYIGRRIGKQRTLFGTKKND